MTLIISYSKRPYDQEQRHHCALLFKRQSKQDCQSLYQDIATQEKMFILEVPQKVLWKSLRV